MNDKVKSNQNLRIENTEIESQSHKMWAEGSCDDEPLYEEVVAFMATLGWEVRYVKTSFDGMQSCWRWTCDLISKI